MRKNITKLISNLGDRIIPILLANDYVRLVDKKKGHIYSNLVITPLGKKLIGYEAASSLNIPDEWIEKYRDLFPRQRRSHPQAIKDKMNRFVEDHGIYSLDEFYKAAKMYTRDQASSKFVCSADHFFYKYDKDGTMRSYCLQYLNILEEEEQENQSEDFSGIRRITRR